MPTAAVIVLASYIAQSALSVVLGGVLLAFSRIYSRPYLLCWARSWWWGSVAAALNGVALYASRSTLPLQVKLLVSVSANITSYLQIAWLALGGYAIAAQLEIAPRMRRWLFIGLATLAVVATLPFAVSTSPYAPGLRFLSRVGVRSLIAAVVLLAVARIVWRLSTGGRSLGRSALATAYFASSVAQLHYFGVAVYTASTRLAVGYSYYLGYLDIVLQAMMGLGMVIWLLEEDREHVVVAASETAVAKEALRDREQQLRAIIDNSPSFVFVKDLTGRYVIVNEPMLRLLGRDASEVLGHTDPELFPPDLAARFLETDLETVRRNGPVELEADFVVGGETRFSLTTKFPLRDASGRPYAVCGIASDYTDRKRLEATLLQAHKLESIGRLAGGVAHDFNNLLTAILGHVELARRALESEHPLQLDLEQIQRAGQRAADLTRQLLGFARRQIIEPRIVDLNDLVEGMRQLLRRLIGETIEAHAELAPALWPVRADPGQMEQVLVNLAVNARDAMPEGGVLTIRTSCVTASADVPHEQPPLPAGEYVMLEVTDNGMGMTDDVRARVFEPFFTTKEIGRGTGLGLATCYGIIKQNNGWIHVTSAPDDGTSFRIYLPRAGGVDAEVANSDVGVVGATA